MGSFLATAQFLCWRTLREHSPSQEEQWKSERTDQSGMSINPKCPWWLRSKGVFPPAVSAGGCSIPKARFNYPHFPRVPFCQRQEVGAAFLLMLCVPLPSASPFNSPCSRSVQQGMNFSHKDCQAAPAFHTTGKGAASQNVTAQSLTPHILNPRPPGTMAAFPCGLCSGIKSPA